MKIAAAAVAALACVQHSLAFVGPQFASRARKTPELSLQDNSDGEIPSWVGPASFIVAGLTVASQVAGASVDLAIPPASSVIQLANGKLVGMCDFLPHLLCNMTPQLMTISHRTKTNERRSVNAHECYIWQQSLPFGVRVFGFFNAVVWFFDY